MKWTFYNLKNWNKFRFIKKIDIGDLSIILLEIDANLYPTKKGHRNLIAIDKNEDIVWIAELPNNGNYDSYFNIDFKDETLLAWTSNSSLCEIDSKTGKILNYKFIK
jgi:hypothetical protein